MPLEISLKTLWRGIADEFSPHGHFEGRAFRLKFGPFALSQSVSGVLPLLFFALHGPANLRFYVMTFFAFKVSAGALLSAAIVSRFFPILLNERALRARNIWGLARVVPFDDIARVAPIQWLFFAPMLRISTHKYRNLVWLPLFLVHQSEFEARVRQWAPEGNPLRRFFER